MHYICDKLFMMNSGQMIFPGLGVDVIQSLRVLERQRQPILADVD